MSEANALPTEPQQLPLASLHCHYLVHRISGNGNFDPRLSNFDFSNNIKNCAEILIQDLGH